MGQRPRRGDLLMPVAPLRRCSSPGCAARVVSGKCAACRSTHYRQQDKQRGTAQQRGYTAQWQAYRLQYLKRNPLCAHCMQEGHYVPAVVVDHIVPINGPGDVLFWYPENHQALCMPCHSSKTFGSDIKTKAARARGEYTQLENDARRWRQRDYIYAADD